MPSWHFFNWDSLHAKLNNHYEAWGYKKKKHKKIITSFPQKVCYYFFTGGMEIEGPEFEEIPL